MVYPGHVYPEVTGNSDKSGSYNLGVKIKATVSHVSNDGLKCLETVSTNNLFSCAVPVCDCRDAGMKVTNTKKHLKVSRTYSRVCSGF